ncbi:MAG: hypothetical protein SAK29_29570 [Scytonema sp. PMC 1069.18]|nr:hypothetical protein [Scytonema sp. PMC 1069.18]MEC4884004.1 hypothetical protein [Scytonema sp. PMC 1070.18]
MKTFISCAVVLGLSIPLIRGDRSFASDKFIAQTANNEVFNVVGTEPFWNVNVSKRGIVYSSPEVKKQTFPYVKPLKAEGRPEDLVRVYQLKGRNNSTLIIKKVNSCSDGMSDKNYPYSATLILGNQVLEGCAERK